MAKADVAKSKSTSSKNTKGAKGQNTILKDLLSKKVMIGVVVVVVLILAVVLTVFFLTRPVSKEVAAERLTTIFNERNTLTNDMENAAKVIDIDGLRADAEKLINLTDNHIATIEETRWPEGLSDKSQRLSGEKVSDMDLYVQDLKKEKEFYQNLVQAEDAEILSVYKKDAPYGLVDTDDFRTKLGMPSKAVDKRNYHELTEDEITEKLQETALDITLGNYYINCKEQYGYTSCDSNLDATVRNKSKVNLTNGGSIDVTAYDNSNNPIYTDTIYIGNRLEKGQTMKQKIFDYVRDEYRKDLLNKPTFKITRVQLY